MSTFLVRHTAVTSAPSAFAICTAKVPPGGAVDQHLLPGLYLPLVAERLKGGQRRDRHGRGFLERHVGRLARVEPRARAYSAHDAPECRTPRRRAGTP